jgi:ABC-type lipoprotein export system ATPase subunit
MPVTATGLAHWFAEDRVLFHDLSFSLRRGWVYGVVGPSGSGKSTLLSLLAGWERPRQGLIERVAVDRIRWVFQNPHGVPRRTVLDHVALAFVGQGLSRSEADAGATELLGRFGLSDLAEVRFGALSGGEAQRLMLARGVASAPDLLLVDEPTAQLDRVTATEVNRTLSELSGQGIIVVIATHDPETRAMCDELIDLDRP